MNIFNQKVEYDKTLWKEILVGVVEAFLWCTILFLLVYGYNDQLVEMLQFMSDHVDEVWSLYFSVLPIFVIIAIVIKLGFFVLKIDAPKAKRTRTVSASKATKKTTTVKKKTTKK